MESKTITLNLIGDGGRQTLPDTWNNANVEIITVWSNSHSASDDSVTEVESYWLDNNYWNIPAYPVEVDVTNGEDLSVVIYYAGESLPGTGYRFYVNDAIKSTTHSIENIHEHKFKVDSSLTQYIGTKVRVAVKFRDGNVIKSGLVSQEIDIK